MFNPRAFLVRPAESQITPAARMLINILEDGALDTLWAIHARNLAATIPALSAGGCACVITNTSSWLRVVDSILPDSTRLYTVCVDKELPYVRGRHIEAAIRAVNKNNRSPFGDL